VSLAVSADVYSATLSLPGKAPWHVSSHNKIAVLQRLVDAYAAGTLHVNTKKLMQGTGCSSLTNLFAKNAPWRNYLVEVEGAHAWQLQLHLHSSGAPVNGDEGSVEAVAAGLNG